MPQPQSISSIAHAMMVLQRCWELQKTVDIPFQTKGAAESFRMRLYTARKRERKAVADYLKIPIGDVRHEWDGFNLTIVEIPGPRWAVRVAIASLANIEMLDAKTGRPVGEVTQTIDDMGGSIEDYLDKEDL